MEGFQHSIYTSNSYQEIGSKAPSFQDGFLVSSKLALNMLVCLYLQWVAIMIVLEFKAQGKPNQFKAVDEAIRTVQFIRHSCIRLWIDHKGTGKWAKNTKHEGICDGISAIAEC